MALTLHSPSSFLSSIDSAKPQKAADRDLPAISISFRSIRLKGRVRAKFIAVKASPEASPAADSRVEERLHRHCGSGSGSGGLGSCRRVPVYVMLPLDTVGICGGLTRARAVGASMMALKSAGVEGVMVDVWWGVVERAGPRRYDWEAYAELVRMAERYGLKMQMVMSFHQCGGNVGDSCHIPLPGWVIEEVNRDPDIVYTDRSGRRNPEYISLGCDTLPVLRGRTPIQVYGDYMQSFRDRFRDYLGNVIVEIQVGTGPCGELRYPSYPESSGAWKFPGIGEFQCYDKYMMASLRAAAAGIGREEWGRSGPHDAGNYRQYPEETGFFRRDGTWKTDYGRFFLGWYSGELLAHGDRVLAAAEGVFRGTGAKLSVKVAGVHWHYDTASHAAELAAGYYNAGGRDGYVPVARVLARRRAAMNFTCMEMRDGEQPPGCSPERLVRQVREAARATKAELAGENALGRYDDGAYARVLETSRADERTVLATFTYLRMSKSLFEGENWRRFVTFVKGMAEGGQPGAALPRCDSVHSDLHVGSAIAGREQEDEFAAAAF